MKNGLSTGEGLVWALRDRHGEDPGRLGPSAARDGARVLQGAERAGTVASLSPMLRQAWDGEGWGC